ATLASQQPTQRRLVLPVSVALLTAAVLVGLVAIAQRPGPGVTVSPTPSSTQPPISLTTYDGDSFAFDYPSDWRFYPYPFVASFFDITGYFASGPFDTDGICETASSATRCNFSNYNLSPGNVVIEL